MASTTALFSGLSGLSTNARKLEVIGNNISNVNTTAYKNNRILFSSAFNRTFSLGTAPTGASGGSNPGQIGLGVTLAGTQRSFSNGAINATGINTDLAVEGDGFFIVERNGEQLFTRAGAFQFNSENDVVTISGDRVQGYLVDDEFNLVEGQLEDVNIPMGTLTIAEATQNVTFSGNLNANGELATQGAQITLGTFTDVTAGPGPATGATLLTNIDPVGTFTVGSEITVSGAERGGKVIPDATLEVTATTTVDDMLEFFRQAMGIYDQGGYVNGADPYAGDSGSVDIDPATGTITVNGNLGELNDLDIDSSDIFVTGGSGVATPFAATKLQSANGESVRTTFLVYDSLGTELQVDLTMTLVSRTADGTYWRPMLHSPDDTDLANFLETGSLPPGSPFGPPGVPAGSAEDLPLLQFDNFGVLTGAPQINISVDRANTGALDPLAIALRFNTDSDNVTAFSDTGDTSSLAAVFQDGSPLGVLNSFSVGEDGIITGGFTNGLTRTIGQVALANFTNPEGLVDAGNNLFATGPNSGTPVVTTPLNFGTGRVIGGALELSNVDLSQQFIDLILTQTGYNAASRVITTTNDLINQLLLLGR